MKKLLHLLLLASALFAFSAFQSGCLAPGGGAPASAQVATQRTLQGVMISVDAAMKAASDMHVRGQLTEARWQEIATFYDTRFAPAFRLALLASKQDLAALSPEDVTALSLQLLDLVARVTAK